MKLTAIAAAVPAVVASEARADIVVFKNGRTMSVKSYLVEADTATLRLRGGGEVTFPASLVARVGPDEVPYPEDVPVAAVAPDAPVASFAPVALALVPEAVLAARPHAGPISTIAAPDKLEGRLG